MVKSMVTAVREGWRAYLDNPKPANEKMHAMNPSMDADTFAQVAEVQKPFIAPDPKSELGGMTPGTMVKVRWETLIGQLKDLGYIPSAMPAEECFRQL
jgi:NitT/TauT family transport system substrate-binding protein